MHGLRPLMLLLALGGCAGPGWGAADAYVLPPGPGASAPGSVISICYGKWFNDTAEIKALIDKNCSGPQLIMNEVDLNVCPLALPVRAAYRCAQVSEDLLNQRGPLPLKRLKN